MLERDLVKKARKMAEGIGAVVVKYTGGPYAESGVADLLICLAGRFIAAEAKRPGHKPTAIQERFLARVRAAGGLAFWFDSIEDFMEELRLISGDK